MNLGALLRIVLSTDLDPETRQALLHALDGEGGEEADEAIETLARALGVLDDAGDVDEETVQDLADQTGIRQD
jgi:hypothetical protein